MLIKKIRIGYCPVCRRRTVFVSLNDWLRESYGCILCRSLPRHRAVIKVLDEIMPDWRKKKIHESSPGGGIFEQLKKDCVDYTYSYFYENKKLGKVLGEHCSNQNLENTTFECEDFDIVITQDVFEHINDPFKAFREIERILKPGGLHIFTVPINPLVKTVSRIKLENGERKAILPEVYHKNPIDVNGSLVTYDWGNDICELIETNTTMSASIKRFDQYEDCKENERLGIASYALYVIVTRKRENGKKEENERLN